MCDKQHMCVNLMHSSWLFTQQQQSVRQAMKYRLTCVSALVLPLSASSFIRAPLNSKTTITTTASHDRCHPTGNRRWPLGLRMTSQAIDLGGSKNDASLPREVDAAPAAAAQDEPPATPAFDRTQLGRHINIGSKVMNL